MRVEAVKGALALRRAGTAATAFVGDPPLRVVEQRGEPPAPPLLLINGLGANLELFDPFLAAVARVPGPTLATVRFDLPGTGGSPALLLPRRLPQLARLVARLLDELGHRQVDVLGVSWGGGLAQQLALQFPGRCRRLVLVSTSTGMVSIPGRPSALLRLLSPRRYLQPSHRAAVAAELYGGRFRSDPHLMARHAHLFAAPSGRGYAWQLLAAAGWTSVHWLCRLRQPTLVLAGDDDPIVPLLNARLLAALLPAATLRVVRDGHLLLLSSAEEVAPLVHGFLTGVATEVGAERGR